MKKKDRIWLCTFYTMVIFLMSLSISFKSIAQESSELVKDVDGNIYKTVRIGTQIWMAESLKTTKYSNGDSIGTTIPGTLDISGESIPKYQWAYDGNESNVETYGRLYTWYAATDSRNICPTGWHVPTDTEWSTITTYLVGESVSGGKLKETGITHWKSPNTGATNESGFTALPGGYRYGSGTFYDIGGTGNWWSSTEVSTNNAWCYTIYNNLRNVNKHYGKKTNDLSVRCVKE
jgi:uncharacterized protein (TIGR02145 family)